MKKTMISIVLLFLLAITTGCTIKETGYGYQPGDLKAIESNQTTSVNDPAMLQLIEMNKTLVTMLQKQNGQQSATVQQPPMMMKLDPKELGAKPSTPTSPAKPKPKPKKVKKPTVSAAPTKVNGSQSSLEKRVGVVEDAVDDLQSRMELNHPGQATSKVKFKSGSSTLTEADKKTLYAEVVKPWFAGQINLLGIAVYDKAEPNAAAMQYAEMLGFLANHGIPRSLLGKKVARQVAINGNLCHVIWVSNDPDTAEKNRQERQAYRVDVVPAAKPK